MLKVLTAFHHRSARGITGMTTKRGAVREWEYPAVEGATDAAGLHPIGVYIKRRQTTTVERLTYCLVYALCTEVERILGMIRMVRWWYQDAVNDLEE